jgi:hypothetical protein
MFFNKVSQKMTFDVKWKLEYHTTIRSFHLLRVKDASLAREIDYRHMDINFRQNLKQRCMSLARNTFGFYILITTTFKVQLLAELFEQRQNEARHCRHHVTWLNL